MNGIMRSAGVHESEIWNCRLYSVGVTPGIVFKQSAKIFDISDPDSGRDLMQLLVGMKKHVLGLF